MPGRSLTRTVGLVVVSILAALLVVSASRVGFLLDALGIGIVLLVISAKVLAPSRPGKATVDDTDWDNAPALSYGEASRASGFYLARGLFMAGMATVGWTGVRLGKTLTVSDFFFVLSTLAAAVEATITRRWFMGLPRLLYVGVFVLTFGGLLTSLTLPHPAESLGVVLRLLYVTLAWFGTAALVLRTPAQVERALRWWVIGLAASGLVSLFQFVTGSGLVATSAGARVEGLSHHPNYLGDSLAIGFVVALVFCLRSFDRDRMPLKVFNLGVLASIGLGIMLSGSLEGFLAMVAATAFWLLVAPPTPKAIPRLMTMFVIGMVVVFSSLVVSGQKSANIFTRLGISHSSDQSPAYSLNLRVSGYKHAIQSIEEQPLVGVGFTAVGVSTSTNEEAVHNMFVRAWYEGGVFSLVGVLIIFGSAFVLLRRRLEDHRGDRGPIHPLTAALVGGMMAYLVSAMSAPILFARIGWVVVAVLIPLRPSIDGERARERDANDRRAAPALSS